MATLGWPIHLAYTQHLNTASPIFWTLEDAMRKSRLDTAETRKRIVSAASNVFLAHGLAATGIAEIMAEAGLTQGGFYRHFESKEQLIAEANRAAFDRLLQMFEDKVAGKPPEDAIDVIVTGYLNQLHGDEPRFLCPLSNLGSELQHADDRIRTTALDGYTRLVRLVSVQTEQLNAADPLALAGAIVSTMVGAVTLSRIALDPAMSRTLLANAQTAIHALLAPMPAK